MKRSASCILICFGIIAVSSIAMNAQADAVSELQAKIAEHNDLIKQLDEEIKSYQGKIGETNAQAKTLKGAIAAIDLEIRKLTIETKSTETKIGSANLTLQSLAEKIAANTKRISDDRAGIGASLRESNGGENASIIESFLSASPLSSAWKSIDAAEQLNAGLQKRVASLKIAETDLEGNKASAETQKSKLMQYKSDLAAQAKLASGTKQDKNSLLAQTKSQESQYQKILAAKQAAKVAFENELFDYESQLKIAIDPSKIPDSRHGTLAWPLMSVRITQLFGKTEDAKRLYVSGTHSGVDFAAAKGTKVMAALQGTVVATGNTDEFPGCYSYGKWVLIDHHNGLSSIYGHLSLISVSAGQSISTGDAVGWSGATGYATGPHLHFGLFATQGVKIQKYTSSSHCKGATIPIAPPGGYLDPMPYFPKS